MSANKDFGGLDDRQVEELKGYLREFVSGVRTHGYPFIQSLLSTHASVMHRDKIVPDIPNGFRIVSSNDPT